MKHHLKGWKQSKPDHRDLVLSAKKAPKSASVRSMCPRVEDQGQLGSCTANATTSAMEFIYRKRGLAQPELSRLFLYYATRVWVEGTSPGDDSGCEIRDVAKATKKFGVPPESLDPYDISKFSVQPTTEMVVAARDHQVKSYKAVKTLAALKRSIGLDGFPVVIGFSVPENMEGPYAERTGIIAYPGPHEQIIGGHAVLAVGYDDDKQLVCFQNSWGASWGDHGFGYLPYSFWDGANPLASDCWTIRDEEL